MLHSNAVGPDEFFGDRVLWDITKIAQEGTLFKGNVDAVAVADVLAALQHPLVDLEGEPHLTAALLKARNGRLADLLRKAHAQVSLFDFLLLLEDFVQVYFALQFCVGVASLVNLIFLCHYFK